MESRINIVIESVVSAHSTMHNVCVENVHHICLARDAMQFMF